ncbi:hypothetical protein EHQ12_17845 [Leptospira gomenensis]|uniref:Uncharacterized protein n=1 Tax=Leptospira gomenensis TaxID=2484974 RepID=A0A5F1YE00_9LEPT|nr:hypothetical protein [Leptospira gomenensis]TGK33201.1 hypothetical protein EHQ12_17845 [Leptospira gomenensis]TGK35566.1 hypothetical protein EHQ17_06480 [Leptospira gomenensis]TGK40890.1 hypothetical protein EHQ07_17440 [Leptospira gomenensis]TGK61180.1 hypothetical protein EHQ13_09975 [Leptospira gomenensis]
MKSYLFVFFLLVSIQQQFGQGYKQFVPQDCPEYESHKGVKKEIVTLIRSGSPEKKLGIVCYLEHNFIDYDHPDRLDYSFELSFDVDARISSAAFRYFTHHYKTLKEKYGYINECYPTNTIKHDQRRIVIAARNRILQLLKNPESEIQIIDALNLLSYEKPITLADADYYSDNCRIEENRTKLFFRSLEPHLLFLLDSKNKTIVNLAKSILDRYDRLTETTKQKLRAFPNPTIDDISDLQRRVRSSEGNSEFCNDLSEGLQIKILRSKEQWAIQCFYRSLNHPRNQTRQGLKNEIDRCLETEKELLGSDRQKCLDILSKIAPAERKTAFLLIENMSRCYTEKGDILSEECSFTSGFGIDRLDPDAVQKELSKACKSNIPNIQKAANDLAKWNHVFPDCTFAKE